MLTTFLEQECESSIVVFEGGGVKLRRRISFDCTILLGYQS